MTPRQPVVSGARLIRALERDGWEVIHQRGSHVRLKKSGDEMRSSSRFIASFGRELSAGSSVMRG